MRELVLRVRTPSRVVFDGAIAGLRAPTPTGQVGVRPGAEAFVALLTPGLVVIATAEGRTFAGTAGGVLSHDGAVTTLFSPFAATGSPEEVLAALDRARSEAGELAALRQLTELEQRITVEVRTGPLAAGR